VVRKAAPFAIEEAQVSVSGAQLAGSQEFIVSLAKDIVAEYGRCAPGRCARV
jgi:hypothetical protein